MSECKHTLSHEALRQHFTSLAYRHGLNDRSRSGKSPRRWAAECVALADVMVATLALEPDEVLKIINPAQPQPQPQNHKQGASAHE